MKPGITFAVNTAGGKEPPSDGLPQWCIRARPGLHCGVIICACLWPCSNAARGHLPEFFGHEYVRAEEDPAAAPAAAPASQAARPGLSAPESHYSFNQQVTDREKAGGPYAPGLWEPLISLGLYYQGLGDYAAARDAYQRALHISRVNDGLNSELQIPILRELLTIYRTMGDYKALDGAYIYYNRLRVPGTPPYEQRTIDDALEYLQWEREAYAQRTDGLQLRHLLQAYLVNARMLRAMAAEPDIRFDWYQQIALSQLQNLYLLLGADPVLQAPSGGTGGTGGSDAIVDMHVSSLQHGAFIKGKHLLRDLVDRAHNSPPREMAAVRLELGDWYQWNGEYRGAGREYAEVVSILRNANEEQLLEQWLAQPMELPDEQSLWQQNRASAGQEQVVVARYKVSARGEISNINVSTSGEDDSGSARRIKSMLLDTHFRPRFSQGKAERSGEVIRRYRLLQ
ncbi:MAG: tetratricopeptide repeat protein [Halioglobus sp.]